MLPDGPTPGSTRQARSSPSAFRAGCRSGSWPARWTRSCQQMSPSTRSAAWRRASTHAMRRGIGSTATPSGTGRAARSASERRSGCGNHWTSPRWRRRRRPSSAGTTSPASAAATDNRSGPFTRSGSAGKGRTITIDVVGDAFLRQMVRSIVAALVRVGQGAATQEDVAAALRVATTGVRRRHRPAPGALPATGRPRTARQRRGTEMTTKTYTPRESEIERRWFVVDATDETLGRLASRIARILEGKHKPTFATHLDSGDHVVVVNAARITVTARQAARRSCTSATAATRTASSRRRSAICSPVARRRPSAARSRACCPTTSWAPSSCAS